MRRRLLGRPILIQYPGLVNSMALSAHHLSSLRMKQARAAMLHCAHGWYVTAWTALRKLRPTAATNSVFVHKSPQFPPHCAPRLT